MVRGVGFPVRGGLVWRLGAASVLLLVLLAGLLGSPAPAPAAPGDPTGDSTGTDFWIAFAANPDSFSVGALTLSVTVAGAAGTTGTVAAPGLATPFAQPFTLGADGTAVVAVPNEANVLGNDVVAAQGVRVTAAAPVAAYGLSNRTYSTDGFLALPVAALGREYRILGYAPTADSNFGPNTAQLTLVGTVAGTTATITPAVTVGTHVAGTPFAVTLGAGQTYRLAVAADLTGTRIVADQPLAAFGGNDLGFVPQGVAYGEYLAEQLPPVAAWRRDFLTAPFARTTPGDSFRILAAEANTAVSIDGTPIATLGAGQFYETPTGTPRTAPSHITADKPILVAQFARGSGAGGAPGDPTMALVPATDQYRSTYTFRPPTNAVYTERTVNLIAPAAAVGQITLDTVAIAAGQFTAIGATGYSYARVAVAATTGHTLAGPLPFGATLYGFGADAAYGYPLGLAFPRVTTTVTSGSATYGDTTATLTAAVTRSGAPVPAGGQVRFTFRGAVVGTVATDAQGVATLVVPLPADTQGGTYAKQVTAEYRGDGAYAASTGTGPLVVARLILMVKPVDQTVKLKQPNPTGCALELAPGGAFVGNDTLASLNTTNLRCTTTRNYPSSNASETVGKVYKISATGFSSANYDLRLQLGTLTVVP